MSLTDRQKTTIQTTLNAKGFRSVCPMCGSNKWDLGGDLVTAAPTQPGGGVVFGGPHMPMIQLICLNCGFVSHHAAAVVGIQINP
jgi:hypothetical protein